MRAHVIIADCGPDRGRNREKLIFLHIPIFRTGEGGAAPSPSSGGRRGRVRAARRGRGGHRGPPAPAGAAHRGAAARANLLTNTNSLSVSYIEPRKSAARFVLIYGAITINSLHRLFEFVLTKNANRD